MALSCADNFLFSYFLKNYTCEIVINTYIDKVGLKTPIKNFTLIKFPPTKPVT